VGKSAIARYDAGAQNLRITSHRIEELLDEARARKRKLICFVTHNPNAPQEGTRASAFPLRALREKLVDETLRPALAEPAAGRQRKTQSKGRRRGVDVRVSFAAPAGFLPPHECVRTAAKRRAPSGHWRETRDNGNRRRSATDPQTTAHNPKSGVARQ